MSECIDWSGYKIPSGYGLLKVDRKTRLAHRVAYREFVGCTWEDMHGLVVMHTCDNPSCVNPEHLVLGTQKQNHLDMVSKGRQQGQRKPIGLDDFHILSIWEGGKSKAEIARELGCSRAAITYSVNRAKLSKSD